MFAVNLYRFILLLRHLGLKISYSELEDCYKSLNSINLSSKQELMWLMQATLVKREQELPLFKAAFDSFFSDLSERAKMSEEWQVLQEKMDNALKKAQADLVFDEQPIELADEEKVFYGQLPNDVQEKIKKFLHESTHGKHMHPEKFKPVIEDLVKGHLKYWQKQLPNILPREIECTGDSFMDQMLYNTRGQLIEKGLISLKDLKGLNSEELTEAKKLLKKLAKRFATRISRRYSVSKKARLVDIRKTIRGNIGYGGIPLQLKYRKRRIIKPSILLLVDISGSMIKYSAFVIQFIYYLSEVVSKIDTFIFSETADKLSAHQIKHGDMTKLIEMIENNPIWGEGTDIYHALGFLQNNHKDVFTQKTFVIIVSDTKTIKPRETVKKLAQLKSKVKKIIWLNPLPVFQWKLHSSVDLFKEHSEMFPCNTLADLENITTKNLI
ncbi:MAG: VWA domain-containing protein [Bacillota bacterium]